MPKVLVVDDAPGVHEMLQTLFSTLKVQDVYASSGEEALDIYEAGGIDVVLTDVRMEEMDGIALLRNLKRRDPECVVILMTALDRKDDILSALKLGAFDFFVKPFLVNEFTASLKRAFAERRKRLSESAPAVETDAAGVPAPASPDAGQLGELKAVRQRLEEQRERLALEEGIMKRKRKQVEEQEAALAEREQQLEQLEAEFQEQNGACVADIEAAREERAEVEELRKALDARTAELDARTAEIQEASAQNDALKKELEQFRQELNERQQDLDQQLASLEESGLLDRAASPSTIPPELMDDEAFAERLAALQEKENLIVEREVFLEQSENALFDKGQSLQELETELQQRRDELEAWERKLKEQGPQPGGLSEEDAAEIEKIRADIERRAEELSDREANVRKRERAVAKAEALIRAREKYLEASESILFDREEA